MRRHSELLPLMFNFTAAAADPAVRIINLPKGINDHRQVCKFALLDRARQALICLAYRHCLQTLSNQYGGKGKGRSALANDLQGDISSGRYTHAKTADVKDHFGSVDGIAIARELRIPEWAALNIVTLVGKEERGRIKLSESTRFDEKKTLTKRAMAPLIPMSAKASRLPQGSICSPLFAAYALAGAVKALGDKADDVKIYADNVLVMGRSAKEANSTLTLLQTTFAGRGASDLDLHEVSRTASLARGLDFVGFRISAKPGTAKIGMSKGWCAAIVMNAAKLVNWEAKHAGKPVTWRQRIAHEESRTVEVQLWCQKVTGQLAVALPAKADLFDAMRRLVKPIRKLKKYGAASDLGRWIERHAPSDAEVAANLNAGARPLPIPTTVDGATAWARCRLRDFTRSGVPRGWRLKEAMASLNHLITDRATAV